jgi:hypothetical protein
MAARPPQHRDNRIPDSFAERSAGPKNDVVNVTTKGALEALKAARDEQRETFKYHCAMLYLRDMISAAVFHLRNRAACESKSALPLAENRENLKI